MWFYLFQLTFDNFENYLQIFKEVSEHNIKSFFEKILNICHYNVRAFAMDAIWQITYITNQFLKEDDVFIYVMRSSEIDTLEKPAEIYPGFCLNMIEIFKTDFVRSNLVFPSNQNYTTAIEIMLDSVFFIRLPEKLQGFTIFNRNILINRKTDLERSNFKLFCGYIFVLILHESAHYFLRISYKKDKEWFEHSTPTTSNEAGNDLERVIFGDVLEHITFRATNYILNVDN